MAYLYATASAQVPAPKTEFLVLSSRFLSVASYDPANYLLTLVFKNGYESLRKFFFPSVWAQFKIHPSPGKFYHEQIKKQYPAIPSKPVLKVSDLTKAKRQHRPNLEVK